MILFIDLFGAINLKGLIIMRNITFKMMSRGILVLKFMLNGTLEEMDGSEILSLI